MQPVHCRPLSMTQNFLHRPALVDRLLDASSIRAGDLVFDLGAGRGRITDRLAQRGCRVVAVEKDLELATRLCARFDDAPAIHVRHADLLTMRFPRRPYKVFANIPFNVTAAIVNRLTQARNPPEDSYLVVQAEAADRFAGQPRGTLVAALLQPWFEPTLVYRFDRTDFAPAPRVDVVMLRLRKRGPPLVPSTDARMYRDFVVSVFAGRHGSLRDNLRDLVGWQRARRVTAGLGLDPAATPSEISVACWLDLFEMFRAAATQRTLSGVVGAQRRLVRQQRRLHKPQRTSTWSNPRTVIECRPPPLPVHDAASPILPQHAPRPSRPATIAMRATVMYGAGDIRVETVPDARLVEPTDAVVHGARYGSDGVDGGQGEAARVPWADGTLVVLPVADDSALIPSLLALADVMSTGQHAAVSARVRTGSTAAVIGDGAVGLCGITAARCSGAEQIILLGRHPDRIALGQQLGATGRGGALGRAGVPQEDSTPVGPTFWKNVSSAGGTAPARAYIGQPRVHQSDVDL